LKNEDLHFHHIKERKKKKQNIYNSKYIERDAKNYDGGGI